MVILISYVGKEAWSCDLPEAQGRGCSRQTKRGFHLLLERCCVSKHAQSGLWNRYLFLSHGLIEKQTRGKSKFNPCTGMQTACTRYTR